YRAKSIAHRRVDYHDGAASGQWAWCHRFAELGADRIFADESVGSSAARGGGCMAHFITEYLQMNLLAAVPLGEEGVWRTLYAAIRVEDEEAPYIQDFFNLARERCFQDLSGIKQP